MKTKKTLSSWLTTKYLLVVRNEENFAEKTSYSFSYAKLIVFALIVFLIILFISLYLVKTVLAQWFDPRHIEMENRQQLVELTIAVDSLENEVYKKDMFISNITRVMKGDVADLSTQSSMEDTTRDLQININNDEITYIPPIDSQFREEFESAALGQVTYTTSSTEYDRLNDIFLFSPLSEGVVSSHYDPVIDHYGVDIVAKKNEPVMCVSDGTVIFSSWTMDSGYVIAIQHTANLISIYKHNSELLEKVGNFVSAGDVIAIIGNTGELTTGPHLHFEIWYNGNPVDPMEFITF